MLPTKKRYLNYIIVFLICCTIATIFYSLWGFNSLIYPMNTDNDFNYFYTMGRSLIAGKVPYRDIYEQKGPLVYLVFSLACLAPEPRLVILILEIICMSYFLLVCYHLLIKYFTPCLSLVGTSIMIFAIFTGWFRATSGAVVEEFCLPIFAYFFLCFLEFLTERRQWTRRRSCCIGLFSGFFIWIKYTMLYFLIVPMLIWLVTNLRQRHFKIIISDLFWMLIGITIVTIPVCCYFIFNNALGQLIYYYFYVSITKYSAPGILTHLGSLAMFFTIGPLMFFLIIYGVARFTVRHWREHTGKLLLLAFLVNLLLLIISSKMITYYYVELTPYALLGIIYCLRWLKSKLNWQNQGPLKYLVFTALCLVICLPLNITTYEWRRPVNDYAPLAIAATIHEYEAQTGQKATLFCYRIGDFGFYNAAEIVPHSFYFANHVFAEDRFPELYQAFKETITEQTSEFVITEVKTWEHEYDFLATYYEPYNGSNTPSIYNYHKVHYFYYRDYEFILLHRRNLPHQVG